MAIFLPEKLIQYTLASGLTAIKAAPSTYIPDIFDDDLVGEAYLTTVTTFLANNTIKISQGYPLDDTRLPGWFVIPSQIQQNEQFIGDFIADDAIETGDETVIENLGQINNYVVKVIVADTNADVVLFLDAIARYILSSTADDFADYNFHEVNISATDFDPVYQYLPQEFAKRTITVSGKGIDTWSVSQRLITDVRIFAKYRDDYEYIEI